MQLLVHLLVDSGGSTDVDEAHALVAAFEAGLPIALEPAIELWLLNCRATLACATEYSTAVTRYRELAERLDARGHLAAAGRFAAAGPRPGGTW